MVRRDLPSGKTFIKTKNGIRNTQHAIRTYSLVTLILMNGSGDFSRFTCTMND